MKIEEAKLGQTVYVKGIITDIDKKEIFDLEIHTSENDFFVNSDDVFLKLDQPKPVVPQFVADWIEDHKGDYSKWDEEARADFVFRAINDLFRFGERLSPWDFTIDEKFSEWTTKNAYEFITAILFDYTVPKEKLYTVEIPNPNEGQLSFVLMRQISGNVSIKVMHRDNLDLLKIDNNLQLTESEIRKDFDWAWQFRKDVENE